MICTMNICLDIRLFPLSSKKERVCDGCFLNMSQSEATLGGATSDNDSGDSSMEERTATQSLQAEALPEPLPGDDMAQTHGLIA